MVTYLYDLFEHEVLHLMQKYWQINFGPEPKFEFENNIIWVITWAVVSKFKELLDESTIPSTKNQNFFALATNNFILFVVSRNKINLSH